MLIFIGQKDCSINIPRAVRKLTVTLLVLLFSPFTTLAQTVINSLSDITDPAGSYTLSSTFSTTGTAIDSNDGQNIGTETKPFTGIIDGGLTTITGTWNKPLFDYIQDATIKNVIIGNASVTAEGNAGAIASNAKGESRIYNCGILNGTVTGSANVGSIVGQLYSTGTANKGSRVVNCFSYANVGGGTVVAGIVGFNGFASTKNDIRTVVMNCMFYGDVTSGESKSPVYGGNKVNNAQGLNNYNYYRYESNFSKNNQIDIYNCALAVEDKYLYHFEYYRLLLNSNKKLAAWYASTSGTTVNPTDMAKWVLETADRTIDDPYPYPILKSQGRYPSIINFDDAHAPTLTLDSKGKPVESQRNKGGKFGDLTVYIQDHTSGNGSREGSFITTGSVTLPITDKDIDGFNYNYYKVRLPYYNDFGSGNYTGGKVVTGWIITGMTGANPTQATSGSDVTITDGVVTATPYNFADRTCTKFADGSYRVFSQGAYFDVPAGVTAITIQPYWANAAFISDSYLDVSYKSDYAGATSVAAKKYDNKSTYTIDGVSDLKVYTNIGDAVGGISTKGSTVYDNALVLVGNFHQVGVPYSVKETPITIMSADFDNDHEPDFSFIYNHTDRKEVSPIRFDFINVPGTAMAQKPNSSTKMCNVGIFKPYGWFEVTNTALMRFGQFEHSFEKKADAPVIFLGGEVEQIVSNNSGNGFDFTKHTSYFLIGGNVWFNEFNNGAHSDKTHPTPHTPVSVSGGRFEKFYLSGIYQPTVTATTDNAECYISGGSFGEVAGAGQEQIDGNVNWIIDYADIDNFYGGGINAAKAITGNIDVVIRNSWVDVYCGGPKFGDMGSQKTVKTQATDCVFRRFFGAGYGGNSYNRVIANTQENTQPWNSWETSYTNNRGKYISNKNGIPTSFEYEYFIGSKGTIWGRFYVNYASFSKATVHNVTSQLTGCYITGDFYGGGSLGVVDGTATSVLDGCTVDGSVFGGGYSATIPNIDITSGGFTTYPTYNSEAGLFTPAEFSASEPYTWQTHAVSNNNSALGDGVIYTASNLTNLGEVANVELTITGNTYVKGDIHTYDEKGVIDDLQTATGGGVFGGGDASAIGTNTLVTINNVAQSNQQSILNVFGGGNQAGVSGNTTVTLTSGFVSSGIYGGCNANGNIGGNTNILLNGGTVGAQASTAKIFGGGLGSLTSINGNVNVTLQGSTVYGDIYGGSALGNVNDDTSDLTKVWIKSGTINGSIYGGGLGDADHAALVNGNVQVIVDGGTISGDVYGCNNVNGAPQGTVTVDINATDPVQSGYAISKVFGGGNQAAYTGSPVVRIHGCDNTIEYVYGGGNQASVRGTGVTVYGGSIGYVFGGGYRADVTHDGTDVNIYGGNIGYVFGGNDHSGTVHGDIDVDIQEQAEPNHQLCALTIGEVYGGGQLADAAGGVTVNVRKSVITGDVYGGGAKANTNTGNIIDQQTIDTDLHVTEVNLYPGATINGDVYGGGRGYKDANPENDIEATVYGDVTVYQLGAVLVPVITDGIAQSGRIFGCNNINGTPKGHVLVYVSKTVKNSESDTYAISAVYGGGNMAEYVPFRIGQDDSDCTEVRIDGCDDVTIHSVYGGGNAASTPATQVFISGAKEIMYVFGGGNGAGNNNPGANVGYHYYDVDGPLGGTTDEDIANRLDPQNHLVYGSGVASTTIYGGHIHYVYGGSNTKGNIREASVSMLDELSDCELQIDGIYGGGRAAYMEGRTSVELGCLTGMEAIYGGSENADVGSDVELTISSGHFDKVFGGNNKGGRIFGSITVNIEQTGCLPITIDELYLGGDNAPYSVYGYKDSTYTVNINGENITHYGLKESGSKYNDPLLNLRSFVSIGTVYGGGNGIHATMVGNPKVDINITHGWINGEYNGTIQSLSQYKGRPQQLANDGVIGTVYGGGNSAKVIGSTNVFIGDKLNDQVDLKSMRTLYNSLGNSDKVKETVTISKTTVNSADAVKYTSNSDANVTITQTVSQTVNGATITGNVYGGGNNADVTGATNIQVGPTIP